MNEPKPQPKTAKDTLKNREDPPGQSAPASSAPYLQGIQEPSSFPDFVGSILPATSLHSSQPVVAPEPIAPKSPNARDVHESFDQLRAAMKDSDANLFKPLKVALVDLVMVGRSIEVRTCCPAQ